MKNVVRHGLLWVIIYSAYTVMLSMNNDPYAIMLINLVNISLYMMAYYSLRNGQLPYLYDRNRIVLFIISLILSSILMYLLYRLGVTFLDGIRGISSKISYDPLADFLVKVIRFYSPAMALLALESHFKGKKKRERIRRLEKEKLANELKFLKAQVNPNFLFNTLNNLYSYVLNDSPKAPDMILRLSAILDYGLYKSQQKFTALNEELQTIENFLNLERIRYGAGLEIDYKVEGDLSVPISPLILLSIVEYAFIKNTVNEEIVPKLYIHIYENERRIYCKIYNTKSHIESGVIETELIERGESGIDMSNIIRQLDLVYMNQYTLEIKQKDEIFNIHLIINTEV